MLGVYTVVERHVHLQREAGEAYTGISPGIPQGVYNGEYHPGIPQVCITVNNTPGIPQGCV